MNNQQLRNNNNNDYSTENGYMPKIKSNIQEVSDDRKNNLKNNLIVMEKIKQLASRNHNNNSKINVSNDFRNTLSKVIDSLDSIKKEHEQNNYTTNHLLIDRLSECKFVNYFGNSDDDLTKLYSSNPFQYPKEIIDFLDWFLNRLIEGVKNHNNQQQEENQIDFNDYIDGRTVLVHNDNENDDETDSQSVIDVQSSLCENQNQENNEDQEEENNEDQEEEQDQNQENNEDQNQENNEEQDQEQEEHEVILTFIKSKKEDQKEIMDATALLIKHYHNIKKMNILHQYLSLDQEARDEINEKVTIKHDTKCEEEIKELENKLNEQLKQTREKFKIEKDKVRNRMIAKNTPRRNTQRNKKKK
tara:strand:+ start:472 stop:1548 length:1077 start_codon:yes stop_codon:yes gene_type:complete